MRWSPMATPVEALGVKEVVEAGAGGGLDADG